MQSRLEVEALLANELTRRGLRRGAGLAFLHDGQAVELDIDESIYRGRYISVLDQGRVVREFRERGGDFDWNAIAPLVVEIAERRAASLRTSVATERTLMDSRRRAHELAAMAGPRASSPLSIEPSAANPGHMRVQLRDLELDPNSVLKLLAALSQALPPSPAGQSLL